MYSRTLFVIGISFLVAFILTGDVSCRSPPSAYTNFLKDSHASLEDHRAFWPLEDLPTASMQLANRISLYRSLSSPVDSSSAGSVSGYEDGFITFRQSGSDAITGSAIRIAAATAGTLSFPLSPVSDSNTFTFHFWVKFVDSGAGSGGGGGGSSESPFLTTYPVATGSLSITQQRLSFGGASSPIDDPIGQDWSHYAIRTTRRASMMSVSLVRNGVEVATVESGSSWWAGNGFILQSTADADIIVDNVALSSALITNDRLLYLHSLASHGACLAKPCFSGVACTSLSSTEYVCGICPTGFHGDGISCEPIAAVAPRSYSRCFPSVSDFTNPHYCASTCTHRWTCLSCALQFDGDDQITARSYCDDVFYAERSPSHTPSKTVTASGTTTATSSASVSVTGTSSASSSVSGTLSASVSVTGTSSASSSVSGTSSASVSATKTQSVSPSSSGSLTASSSVTGSASVSVSSTVSSSITASSTGSSTVSSTVSASVSTSVSSSVTTTSSITASFSVSGSSSVTATSSVSPSPSQSATRSQSDSASITLSSSATKTPDSTFTPTSSVSTSLSTTVSPSESATQTVAPSLTPTRSESSSPTAAPTSSTSLTASISLSLTPTRTLSISITASSTPTPSRAPFLSCASILESNPSAVSGVYAIQSSGSTVNAYCDMTTDGGGWTLMLGMNAPVGPFSSAAKYTSYFRTNLWINGFSDGVPDAVNGNYSSLWVFSHDWRNFLTTDVDYEIRQNFWQPSATDESVRTLEVDLGFEFTYNGRVVQDSAPDALDERSWILRDMRTYVDNSGITWNRPTGEVNRFWLPFSTAYTGSIVSGCNAFEFSTSACTASSAAQQRYGNAGVVGGSGDSNDPAASWAPHMNTNFDIVYIHQNPTKYGQSAKKTALRYWIRPRFRASTGVPFSVVRPTTKRQDYSTCTTQRVTNQTSGVYTLNRGSVNVSAFCDMSTQSRAWTLMSQFAAQSTANGRNYDTNSMYTNYFTTSSLWIVGNAQGLPLSASVTADQFRVLSQDWRNILVAGRRYWIRQNFYRPGSGSTRLNEFDVTYSFRYNGYVRQNDAPADLNQRGWVLTSRSVITDVSTITWNIPTETVRFWLPIHSGVSGSVLTGCSSIDFAVGSCQLTTAGSYRYGNAGIIGASADSNDPAGAWAPHARQGFDLVYVHQAPSIFGTSGAAVVLQYWISEA